jgi:hypothetical protein
LSRPPAVPIRHPRAQARRARRRVRRESPPARRARTPDNPTSAGFVSHEASRELGVSAADRMLPAPATASRAT